MRPSSPVVIVVSILAFLLPIMQSHAGQSARQATSSSAFEQARATATTFWSTKYRRCGEEWLSGYRAPYERHWKASRGFRWDVALEPVTEAERLNGVEWKAITSASVTATREFFPNGGWQPWQEGNGMGAIGASLYRVHVVKMRGAAPSLETSQYGALDQQYAPADCGAADRNIQGQATAAMTAQVKQQALRKLADAIASRDSAAVDAALKAGADIATPFNDLQFSHPEMFGSDLAICYAVRRKAIAVIERLLAAGAGPNSVCGDTVPLYIAVQAEPDFDAIKVLLRSGANPTLDPHVNSLIRSPLAYATSIANDPSSHGQQESQLYQRVVALLRSGNRTPPQAPAPGPSIVGVFIREDSPEYRLVLRSDNTFTMTLEVGTISGVYGYSGQFDRVLTLEDKGTMRRDQALDVISDNEMRDGFRRRWRKAAETSGIATPSMMIPPPPQNATASTDSTYRAKCAMCHALDGSGNPTMVRALGVRDLRAPDVQNKTDADLRSIIENGKNKMQGYTGKLSDQDINALVGHIRRFNRNTGLRGGRPAATPVPSAPSDTSEFSLLPASAESAEFENGAFAVKYPSNWKARIGNNGELTIGPSTAMKDNALAYGVVITTGKLLSSALDDNAFQQFVKGIIRANPGTRQVGGAQDVNVNGVAGKSADLLGSSPIKINGNALPERDWIIAVPNNKGAVVYAIFVSPEREFATLRPVYDRMLRSLRVIN